MFGVCQSRGHTPGVLVSRAGSGPGRSGLTRSFLQEGLPGGLGPLPPTCLSGEGWGRDLARFLCPSVPENARNARDLSG